MPKLLSTSYTASAPSPCRANTSPLVPFIDTPCPSSSLTSYVAGPGVQCFELVSSSGSATRACMAIAGPSLPMPTCDVLSYSPGPSCVPVAENTSRLADCPSILTAAPLDCPMSDVCAPSYEPGAGMYAFGSFCCMRSCMRTPRLPLGENCEYERYWPTPGVSLTSRKRRDEGALRIGPALGFFCRRPLGVWEAEEAEEGPEERGAPICTVEERRWRSGAE